MSQDRDQPGIFADALRRLDRAGRIAAIDDEVLARLKHPRTVIEVSIPVRMPC